MKSSVRLVASLCVLVLGTARIGAQDPVRVRAAIPLEPIAAIMDAFTHTLSSRWMKARTATPRDTRSDSHSFATQGSRQSSTTSSWNSGTPVTRTLWTGTCGVRRFPMMFSSKSGGTHPSSHRLGRSNLRGILSHGPRGEPFASEHASFARVARRSASRLGEGDALRRP